VAGVPAALKTTVTELGDSRVRLEVEVPSAELEGRLERTAAQLGRELKLPGFRRGKVPAPLVIQRIGREAVLEQTVRDTLSTWYSDAIESAGIVPVGDPELDVGELPAKGGALAFSVEIGVLPKAKLGPYRGLQVPRREPVIADEQVQQEVEAMRERLARLEQADRSAQKGDFVVIDYAGTLAGEEHPFDGGSGRDQLVELGGGALIPGFEEGLIGTRAGEAREVSVTFPADYGNAQLAGREATFSVTVKEVKVKQLPDVDEDFAIDAGFDDLEELRADISRRLLAADEARVEAEFRTAALDAAVAGATVGVTTELAKARATEMWERMLHSLAHRGISRQTYLAATGRAESEVLAEMEPEAEQALRREAVISAVVAKEGISPTEEELAAALTPIAEREGVDAQTLLGDLEKAGRLGDVREDLAARTAIDLIAESATPIAPAQARAREALWTPEKAATAAEESSAAQSPGKLWTPADPRPAS
jgi:trigger factor